MNVYIKAIFDEQRPMKEETISPLFSSLVFARKRMSYRNRITISMIHIVYMYIAAIHYKLLYSVHVIIKLNAVSIIK